MNVDEFERHILTAAAQWSFLRTVDTVDKTDYAVKLRLHVDVECFIQIYANVHKASLATRLFSIDRASMGEIMKEEPGTDTHTANRITMMYRRRVGQRSPWHNSLPKHKRY